MEGSEIVILAVVQGLTEFLPVSSSGHLVAARLFFGISDTAGLTLDAFLHLGTLAAVLAYYWRVWWGIARGIFTNDSEGKDKRELAGKLAIATIPAAIVGYAAQDIVGEFFRSSTAVALGLLFTAGTLWLTDLLSKRTQTIARASFKDAVIIGLAQVIALVPGISRSGITIAAGRTRGLSRKQAATFSFLMSAPIIAGAGLAGFGSLLQTGGLPVSQLAMGFLISFAAGLAAICLLLKIVEKVAFWPFAIYLVGLAFALIYVG